MRAGLSEAQQEGDREGEREKIVICQCWNESRKPAICVRETDRERGGWVGMDTC